MSEGLYHVFQVMNFSKGFEISLWNSRTVTSLVFSGYMGDWVNRLETTKKVPFRLFRCQRLL